MSDTNELIMSEMQPLMMKLAQLLHQLTSDNVVDWEAQSMSIESIKEGRFTNLSMDLTGKGSEVLPRLLTGYREGINALIAEMKAIYDKYDDSEPPVKLTCTVSKDGKVNFDFAYEAQNN